MQSPWLNIKAIVTVCFLVAWGGVWGQYFVDFEDDTKGGYASGTVTLNGFDWDFTEALIGDLPTDFKNGLQSARLRGRNGSVISMLQNKAGGIGEISFEYRQFGNDNDQQPWAVEYSTNNGSSWTQIGSLITGTAAVQAFSEIVNVPGNVRVRIRLTTNPGTGGNRRLNIDDILITDYTSTCSSAPATGPTSFTASGIGSGDFNFSWNDATGFNSLAVISEGALISGVPSNGTLYSPSPVFGAGDPLGDGFVNFTSQGGSSAMSGANAGSIYNVDIYSFCDNGYLYNTTSSLSGQVLTEPANPSFSPLCSSSSSITLYWDNPPEGDWDGFVILGREGAAPTSINSVDPATLLPNPNFGLAPLEGVNSILYEGNGNSVIITGLTPGSSYTFKILAYKECGTCINPFEYSTGTQITGVAELNDVVNFSSTAQATSMELGWNFSTGCADEVIIVASEAPITGLPSGSYTVSSPSFIDGVNPTLNAGEVVVYSGLGNTVTVTNLTTDTEYCFNAFLRRGSEWSSGVSVCETASATTIFEPGDLSIVAINASAQSPEEDEVCFIAYRSISTGTTIDLTDNGYERVTAGLWGDTEGVIRLERTGGPIAPGTTICMLGSGNSDAQLSVLTCGIDDGGWSISSLNGLSNFALNDADQVWIMQGGNWINPAGSHDATYTGNILYGWTAIGWEPVPGYDETFGSTLFPNSTCLSTDLETLGALGLGDRVKYTGPMTPATKTAFIQAINNDGNWTGYATDGDYFSTGPHYSEQPCITFDILPFIPTPGEWTGAASNDWLDCLNWEDLLLPTQSIDVNIPVSTILNPEITGPGAVCRDLVINSGTQLDLTDPSATLDIYGDVVLDGPFGAFDGTVSFLGNENQALTVVNGMGASTLNCNNLIINKPSGRLLAEGVINIDGNLDLQEGIIDLITPEALVQFTSTSSVIGGSELSFINGPAVRTGFEAAQEFIFPVGYFEPGNPIYQPASLTSVANISSGWRVQYFHENYNIGLPDPTNPPVLGLNSVSTCNYWLIDRTLGTDPIRVGLSWNEAYCFDVTDPAALTVARFNSLADEWEDAPFTPGVTQTNSGDPYVTGWVKTTQTVNNFSPFAIGAIGNNLNVLPITLLSFSAQAAGKNLVETHWSTASETNNDYFTIERSRDAAFWEPIGFVPGAGNSNTTRSYSLSDDAPFPGLSYYRLKQTDYDGSFAYSHAVPVQIDHFGEDLALIQAYRDGDKLALLYTAESPQIRVELYSVVGQKLHSINVENTDGFVRINLPQLAHGVYIVRISSGTDMATAKFFY